MTNKLKAIRDALDKCYVPNGRGSNSLSMQKAYDFIAANISVLEDALDSIMAVPDGYVMVPTNEYTQLKNIQNAFQGVINMAAAPKHGGE